MTQCCCPCFLLLRSWILDLISVFMFSASLSPLLKKKKFLNILLREEVKCKKIISGLLRYQTGPHLPPGVSQSVYHLNYRYL